MNPNAVDTEEVEAREMAYMLVSSGVEMTEVGWERKKVWSREHALLGGETRVARVWMMAEVQLTEVIAGSESAEIPSYILSAELHMWH